MPHLPSLHPPKKPLRAIQQINQSKLQTSLDLNVICFLPSKHLPSQNIPAGTAWESTLKMEILLVNNVTRSMRPKNMQSSDLKTIIAKAENQMNGLCFCCIQNVNARSTAKKTNKTKNPKTHHPTYGIIYFLKGDTLCYLLVPLTSHQSSLGLCTISNLEIIPLLEKYNLE